MLQTWRNSWRQHKHFLFLSLSLFKFFGPCLLLRNPHVAYLLHIKVMEFSILLTTHPGCIFSFQLSICQSIDSLSVSAYFERSTEDIRKNKTQPLPSGTLLLRVHLHVLTHICAHTYTCTHTYIAKVFYLPNDSLVCLLVIWWSECEEKLFSALGPESNRFLWPDIK